MKIFLCLIAINIFCFDLLAMNDDKGGDGDRREIPLDQAYDSLINSTDGKALISEISEMYLKKIDVNVVFKDKYFTAWLWCLNCGKLINEEKTEATFPKAGPDQKDDFYHCAQCLDNQQQLFRNLLTLAQTRGYFGPMHLSYLTRQAYLKREEEIRAQ